MSVVGIATFTADARLQKIELPKSGSVICRSSEDKDATHYEVLLQTPEGNEIMLSSTSVPLPHPVGIKSRGLFACDENKDMIVVLLAEDMWNIVLLQYDLVTKVVKEQTIYAQKLTDKRRNGGGTLSVQAPNRITLSEPNGTSQTWSVVDGNLIDESGNVFLQADEDELRQMELLRDLLIEKRAQSRLKANPAPSLNPASPSNPASASISNEELALSPLAKILIGIFLLIVLVLGFLCKRVLSRS